MDEILWLRDMIPAVSLGIVASFPFIAFLWVHEAKLRTSMPTERQLVWFRGLFLVSYLVVATAFFDALSDPSVTIGIVGATSLLLVFATVAFFRPFYREEAKRVWFSWMFCGAAMLVGAVAFSIGAALQYINHYSTAYGDDVMSAAVVVMAFAGAVGVYRVWDERRKGSTVSGTNTVPT
jgi:hypothetical protein